MDQFTKNINTKFGARRRRKKLRFFVDFRAILRVFKGKKTWIKPKYPKKFPPAAGFFGYLRCGIYEFEISTPNPPISAEWDPKYRHPNYS